MSFDYGVIRESFDSLKDTKERKEKNEDGKDQKDRGGLVLVGRKDQWFYNHLLWPLSRS